MRYFYSFLFYLIIPFILLRLIWRSIRQPIYRQRIGERFGYYPYQLQNSIWVHAVSVGEAIAAIPLIKALQIQYPTSRLLVTTMTPTGAARVQAAFGDTVQHAYIPYDLPGAMQRFMNTMNPAICIIMETELWPNLLAACEEANVPMCLVNARLSEKSARGYHQIGGMTRTMLQQLSAIAAHGELDALRFIELGAPKDKVTVTGNIKFDISIPDELRAKESELLDQLGKDRFIWVAASTHEGEEEIILAAHKKICEKDANALLILVPRHPNRFDMVAKMAESQFVTARRSQQQLVMPGTQVYLADTMGELLLMYAVADVAFVAGSLVPRGGHNMLEAAALGKPLLTGPHLFNFAEISEMLIAAQAMKVVTDAETLAEQLTYYANDLPERAKMGKAALQVVMNNRGALDKQMAVIAAVKG